MPSPTGRLRISGDGVVRKLVVLDRVILHNAPGGTEVEWGAGLAVVTIPESVGEGVKKSISAVEGFCMGLGLGVIALTFMAWMQR